MIVRRDYRYTFYQRRRAARVRVLLLFALVMVIAMTAVLLNLNAVQGIAAQALGFNAVPTLYPAQYAMFGAQAYQRGNMSEAARQFERAVALQPLVAAWVATVRPGARLRLTVDIDPQSFL